MCLTGRSYDAQEALAIGLVNRVVSAEELLPVATQLAQSIASLPAGLAQSSKQGFVAHQPEVF